MEHFIKFVDSIFHKSKLSLNVDYDSHYYNLGVSCGIGVIIGSIFTFFFMRMGNNRRDYRHPKKYEVIKYLCRKGINIAKLIAKKTQAKIAKLNQITTAMIRLMLMRR
jgi:hypothetical protein